MDRKLAIVFSVTLMSVIGISTVSPAFPGVIEEFAIDPEQVSWLVTAYALPGVLMAPVTGALADLVGRRTVLVPALLLFGIAGGMCSLTGDFATLVALRAFQGAGAGAVSVLNVTLIGDMYRGDACVEAMGYNASVLSAGTAAFPAIGGVLATVAWFMPFAVSVVAVPIAIVVALGLGPTRSKRSEGLRTTMREVAREMLSTGTICLLVTTLLTFILLMGPYFTFVPILIGEVYGEGPLVIGGMMALMSVMSALASSRLRPISDRLGGGRTILLSFALFSMGFLLVLLHDGIWALAVPISMFGLAQGLSFPAVQVMLSRRATDEYRASLMSVNVLMLKTGQTIGPLTAALCYSSGGLDAVFALGLALSTASAIGMGAFTLRTLRTPGRTS